MPRIRITRGGRLRVGLGPVSASAGRGGAKVRVGTKRVGVSAGTRGVSAGVGPLSVSASAGGRKRTSAGSSGAAPRRASGSKANAGSTIRASAVQGGSVGRSTAQQPTASSVPSTSAEELGRAQAPHVTLEWLRSFLADSQGEDDWTATKLHHPRLLDMRSSTGIRLLVICDNTDPPDLVAPGIVDFALGCGAALGEGRRLLIASTADFAESTRTAAERSDVKFVRIPVWEHKEPTVDERPALVGGQPPVAQATQGGSRSDVGEPSWPADWYTDPWQSGHSRWWDGKQWTTFTRRDVPQPDRS